MNILMASSEMVPLAKTGGLGDVLGALPLALAELGHQVTVVVPFYKFINAHKYGIELDGEGFSAVVGGERIFGGLHRWRPRPGVTVYLVAQDEFFGRSGIYGGNYGAYADNHRRFIFLSLATVEVARRLAASGRAPDVFHGHDWHVGLVPVYLRLGWAGYRVPTVFSIHNLQYQGRYGHDLLYQAGLPEWLDRSDLLELYGSLSFMKAGLVFSDMLSAVSRAYAREVQTPEFGEGLDGLLRARHRDLIGIVNGIDDDVWNPATDPHLAATYSAQDMRGKLACKLALQREFGLPVRGDVPVLACVTRLVDQKGIDLLGTVLPQLLSHDVQVVIVGSGERRYQSMLEHFAQTNPYQMSVFIGFDESKAHRVEAGADIFMMPSRFEPCGLNQMYSLRYGTVPVVRAVGGLDDTVHDFDPSTGRGNGFKFRTYDGNGLWWALSRALRLYRDSEFWGRFRTSIMDEDFSWKRAAHNYVALYRIAEDRAGY